MSHDLSARGLTSTQQHWAEHLRRCEAQGLSIRAYAEAHGLSAAAMRSAKRDFTRRAARSTSAAPSEHALTLVPLAVDALGRAGAPAMQLRFPGGVEAQVSAEAAAAVSAALMHAAMQVQR